MSEAAPDARQWPASDRLMRHVGGIETGYLNACRIFAVAGVVLGVLAVGGAILNYAFAQFSSVGTHSSPDYFEAPAWESIRHRVLPTAAEQSAAQGGRTAQSVVPAAGRQPVDERISQIADNLNAQFARNPGHESGFTDRYPRRLLEAWAFEDSGVPPAYLDDFAEQLIALSKVLGEDGQINRIGSMDDRAKVIMNALEEFRQEFAARLQQAESTAAAANAAAAASQAEAEQLSAYLGIAGLGLLLALVLIVIPLRIESHLRNLAPQQAIAPAADAETGLLLEVDG